MSGSSTLARSLHSKMLANDARSQDAPPPVLLSYQQAWVADEAQLKIAEKSRRIGLTWAEASDNVLIAAREGGTNVFYIGPTHDMALEYIEACAMWARAFNMAASQIEEGIFVDGDGDGAKAIKTYKIDFPGSGRRIVALSSRPTNLRGKQGVIVIDEAAFQPDLPGLLKAAMAMLLWGDRVRIISTHNGDDNEFNELITEVRAKKRKGSVHRFDFRGAVSAGLYRRVCIRRGKIWSQADEDAWVADAYAYYAEDAAEELDVIPAQGGGAYLSLAMLDARMSPDTPLVRERWPAPFGLMPERIRRLEIEEWCEVHLGPVLNSLSPDMRHYFGEDFGRVSDLSVITVAEEGVDLVNRVKLVVELANCPFTQQEQILWYILDRLPRFTRGAMDAGGNGAALAEKTADRYGHSRIDQVKLTVQFYVENFPPFKAALEDGTFTDLPKDREVRDDHRAIRVIRGVPRLPDAKTQKGDAKKSSRHGDSAIASLMVDYAMRRDVIDISGVQTSGEGRASSGLDDFFDGDL